MTSRIVQVRRAGGSSIERDMRTRCGTLALLPPPSIRVHVKTPPRVNTPPCRQCAALLTRYELPGTGATALHSLISASGLLDEVRSEEPAGGRAQLAPYQSTRSHRVRRTRGQKICDRDCMVESVTSELSTSLTPISYTSSVTTFTSEYDTAVRSDRRRKVLWRSSSDTRLPVWPCCATI